MTELPVVSNVSSCDDCGGSCCRKVGSPPGWLFDLRKSLSSEASGLPIRSWPRSEWGASLPDNLFEEMLTYVESRGRRYDQGLSCFWLDEATGRCKNYLHRPEACQEFDVGGEDCQEARRREGK